MYADDRNEPKAEPTQETLDDLLCGAGFEVTKGLGTPPLEFDAKFRKIASLVLQTIAMDAKLIWENLDEWKKNPKFRETMRKDGVGSPENEGELAEMLSRDMDVNIDFLEHLQKTRCLNEVEVENL